MDSQQQKAFNSILSGDNVFLTGEGGCGKTYVIKQIISYLANTNDARQVFVTASTGCAAINLGISGATTYDSLLKILPYMLDLEDYILLSKNFGNIAESLGDQVLLIVDEVSMINASKLNMIYEILCFKQAVDFQEAVKTFVDSNLEWRTLDFDQKNAVKRTLTGMCKAFRRTIYSEAYNAEFQILLSGDLYQLPPVVKHADHIFESICWNKLNMKTINIRTQHRQESGSLLHNALKAIREGIINDKVKELVTYCSRPLNVPSMHLFAKNKARDVFNQINFQQLDGDCFTSNAQDVFYGPNLTDHLRSFYRSRFKYPASSQFKVGAQVMLTRNVDVQKGLVNGSVGTVLSIENGQLSVSFANGVVSDINKDLEDLHEVWYNRHISKYETIKKASRLQYPLVLAYGMTIHKSQSLTLSHVTVDCSDIFESGQLYTALSRARHEDGLCIKNFSAKYIFEPNATIQRFYTSTIINNAKDQFMKRIETSFSSLSDIRNELNISESQFRLFVKSYRDKLLRQQLDQELSPELTMTLSKLQKYMSGGLTTHTTIIEQGSSLLFIECPSCREILTERQMLIEGLYCCLQSKPKILLDAVTDKFGWATYIIHGNNTSLHDKPLYVGVTTHGKIRLRTHQSKWLKDVDEYVVRCSVRLPESLAIPLFKPVHNKYTVGGSKDSWSVRLRDGATHVKVTINDILHRNYCQANAYDLMQDNVVQAATLVKYSHVSMLVIDSHLSCGITSILRSRLGHPTRFCFLIGQDICQCKIPCWLRKINNENFNYYLTERGLPERPLFYPYSNDQVKPKPSVKHKSESLPPIVESGRIDEWSLNTLLVIAQRGRFTQSSRYQICRSVRRLWRMGVLQLKAILIEPHHVVNILCGLYRRQDVIDSLQTIVILLGKLSENEFQVYFGQTYQVFHLSVSARFHNELESNDIKVNEQHVQHYVHRKFSVQRMYYDYISYINHVKHS